MKVICEFCGKAKDENKGYDFVIGASPQPDWTMVEGTGKMTCPDCFKFAVAEGQEKVEQSIRRVK
uniref:Uncharacterized protein n=1 Tax=viral metagenome TaxID=1070528 RepID=A0A6M3M7S4_9ZZZZ